MALLTVEDQGLQDMNFLWESSNSDYSGESKENMKSPNQKEERDEALVNNKRNRDETNITSAEGKNDKCRESDHEMHIWTERERRKKMRNMFSNLHALLPHLPSKADKSTIVDEAVSTIKNLEQTLEKLEKQKEERGWSETSMFVSGQGSSNSNATMGTTSNALSFPVVFDKTWASSNLVLNIFGDEAQFSIFAARKPGLISSIAFVLDKYKIDLITANVSCIANGNACIIQLHGKGASHDQFLDANSVEEIYKQAAGEIMLWIA